LTEKVYPQFQGKKIRFFSVSPHILGATPIYTEVGLWGVDIDMAFIGREDNVPMAMNAVEIWAEKSITPLGYYAAEGKFKDFRQWKRKCDVPFHAEMKIPIPYHYEHPRGNTFIKGPENQVLKPGEKADSVVCLVENRITIKLEDEEVMMARMMSRENSHSFKKTFAESPLLENHFQMKEVEEKKVDEKYRLPQTFPNFYAARDEKFNVSRLERRKIKPQYALIVKENMVKRAMQNKHSELDELLKPYGVVKKDQIIRQLQSLIQGTSQRKSKQSIPFKNAMEVKEKMSVVAPMREDKMILPLSKKKKKKHKLMETFDGIEELYRFQDDEMRYHPMMILREEDGENILILEDETTIDGLYGEPPLGWGYQSNLTV